MPSTRKRLGSLHCQIKLPKVNLIVFTSKIRTPRTKSASVAPPRAENTLGRCRSSDTRTFSDPLRVFSEIVTDSWLDFSMWVETSRANQVFFKHNCHDPPSTWHLETRNNKGAKVDPKLMGDATSHRNMDHHIAIGDSGTTGRTHVAKSSQSILSLRRTILCLLSGII
jgi:hypothetical protein